MSKANPVVLITGALTGIGRATALAFARQGARVVISGRREEAGKALERELSALGAEALFVRADVRIEADVRAAVDATLQRFERLDVAVNNAGVEGTLAPVSEATVEKFHEVFDTNVLGTLLSMKYELPQMLEQRSGSIINVSSVAGHIGMANASIYAASKHAVEGLTRVAALEGAAAGVRVNAVAPGPVETDMLDRFVGRDQAAKAGFLATIPGKRVIQPEEIAETILFLASDRTLALMGQIITVDGAYTAQ